MFHQQARFAADIVDENTVVGLDHPNQEVALAVIGAGDLPRFFPDAVDAMFRQLASHWKDKPNCYFPQYNTLLLASREISPNERRP